MLEESPYELLHFADTGLQNLEWGAPSSNPEAMPGGSARKLTSLTGLTRLQLSDFRGTDRCLHAVRTFAHLRMLCLHGCQPLEAELFVPGALQSLQILSIVEGSDPNDDSHLQELVRSPDAENFATKLSKAVDVVLNLPHLSSIYGEGRFYSTVGSLLPASKLTLLKGDPLSPQNFRRLNMH